MSSEKVVEDHHMSEEDEGPKTFKDRLEDIPSYNIAVSNLSSWYNYVKGSGGYLASAINTGEDVAAKVAEAAKPVAMVATDMACKVAKPVVGEVTGAKIDGCAAELLAKVQEKIPVVRQDPREYVESVKTNALDKVESVKSSAKDTANYYMDKVQNMAVTQKAVQQLDNAVAMGDLIVELVLPTDTSCEEDILELEKEEEDEDGGVLAHAHNVKRKAVRRGKRKLMSYKHVQSSVDMVQYAQNQISETTNKLLKGSSYVASTESTNTASPTPATPSSTAPPTQIPSQPPNAANGAATDEHTLAAELAAAGWETVHKTSMYIPEKALEVTGEVYVSAQEMVFQYSNVKKMTEIPSAVSSTVESYYNSVRDNQVVKELTDKAVAFAYVPTQVISSYIQSNRAVQWIIPQHLRTESIQVVENTSTTTQVQA